MNIYASRQTLSRIHWTAPLIDIVQEYQQACHEAEMGENAAMRIFSKLLITLMALQCVPLQGDPHQEASPALTPDKLDLTEIFVAMTSDDFQTREAATFRLLEMSRPRLAAVAQALFEEARTSPDPEVRFRSKETFRRIFDFRVLGKGDANLGVQWQWHIQLAHTGEMRARPLARSIQPNSPAAQAGLKAGDIVCYVNGKE